MTYRQYRVTVDGRTQVSTEDGKFVDVPVKRTETTTDDDWEDA